MTKLDRLLTELMNLLEGLKVNKDDRALVQAAASAVSNETLWCEKEPAALADQILELRTRVRVVTAELNKANADLSRALGKVDDLTSTVAGLRAELSKRA